MDDDPNSVWMAVSESMIPMIEWAEGQKAMLISRGWSAESAERYATELLCGATRTAWAQATK